jgi:hypothetical protein
MTIGRRSKILQSQAWLVSSRRTAPCMMLCAVRLGTQCIRKWDLLPLSSGCMPSAVCSCCCAACAAAFCRSTNTQPQATYRAIATTRPNKSHQHSPGRKMSAAAAAKPAAASPSTVTGADMPTDAPAAGTKLKANMAQPVRKGVAKWTDVVRKLKVRPAHAPTLPPASTGWSCLPSLPACSVARPPVYPRSVRTIWAWRPASSFLLRDGRDGWTKQTRPARTAHRLGRMWRSWRRN